MDAIINKAKNKDNSNSVKRFFCWVKLAQSMTWVLGGLTLIIFFLITIKIGAFEKELKEKHLDPIHRQIARIENDSLARDSNILRLEEGIERLEGNTVNREIYKLQMESINEKVRQLSEDQKTLINKFDDMKNEIIDVLKKNNPN